MTFSGVTAFGSSSEPAWTITVASGFDLDMWQLIAVGGLLVAQGLINHYGIRLTTRLTDFSGYLIFVVAVVLVGALLAGSTVPLDVGRLVTFENYTGDAGGGVFPATGAAPFAFLLGLLFVCYTITGFDASAHTSEETHDAQVNVPRGMWTAVLVSWVAGFIMVCTFVLVLPSVKDGAGQGWNSFYYLYEQTAMPAGVSSSSSAMPKPMPFSLARIFPLGIEVVLVTRRMPSTLSLSSATASTAPGMGSSPT